MAKKTTLSGQATDAPDAFKAQLSEYMRALGRKGGKASGDRRMTNLSAEQRREIAAAAAKARWRKSKLAKDAALLK